MQAKAGDYQAQAEERGASGVKQHAEALHEVSLAGLENAKLHEHNHRVAHGFSPPGIEPAQPAIAPPEMPEAPVAAQAAGGAKK